MKAFLTFLIILTLSAPMALADVYHDYYGPYGGDDWIDWKEDWEENNKSHATPPFAPRQTFGGCFISTGKGLLEDLDCDKAPDIVDNCIGVPNPTQTDQNQNNVGDDCDLIVDRIDIDPQGVMEGRSFTVTATLTNYRAFELRNVQLTVQVPELGLEMKEYVDRIEAGEQGRYVFYMRLPNCVRAKDYDVVLFVEFPAGPGMQEFFYIPTKMGAVSSGMCEQGLPDFKSIINILDIQDVDKENGGVYPFTIVNAEPYGQAYVLTIEGTEEWGNYEIRPRSLIVVPAGESREGEIVLYANDDAEGEHGFLLTLRSKADAQQVLLKARIKQDEPGPSAQRYTQLGIVIVVLIIIVTAIGIFLHKAERRKRK